MGLFDRLFAKPDPSRKWAPDPNLRLEFDFDRYSLSAVRLGEPMERLTGLGPPEDRRAALQEDYCYFSKGLEVDAYFGVVVSYALIWNDERYKPFSGILRHQSAVIALGPRTREVDIVERFGKPYWHHEDEDDIILFYERGLIEWQVEMSPELQLNAIVVCTPPLFSDVSQRQIYGVTKPWPPQEENC